MPDLANIEVGRPARTTIERLGEDLFHPLIQGGNSRR